MTIATKGRGSGAVVDQSAQVGCQKGGELQRQVHRDRRAQPRVNIRTVLHHCSYAGLLYLLAMSTYVGKFLLTGEQKSAAKMYLCRYIGIIYTVCHPTHFKTHVYVHMYNTLQESLSI